MYASASASASSFCLAVRCCERGGEGREVEAQGRLLAFVLGVGFGWAGF